MTVRIESGCAARWTGLRHVLLTARPAGAAAAERFEVDSARSYRDRLVLKLRGIEDASAAAAVRGRWVLAPADEVPELPAGEYYAARLVGLAVVEENGTTIGRVADVLETAAGAILVLEQDRGGEAMIPLVREFVREVDESRGVVRVRLPDGLLELNDR